MKKIFICLTVLLMSISLVGCGNNNQTVNDNPDQVHVEKEIFDVIITLPESFTEDTTQEELDAMVEEGKFHSAVLNEDKTVTFEMSKIQHRKLMNELAESIDSSMSEMIGSEDFPNYVNVEANKQYSHFTITVKTEELSFTDTMSVLGFFLLGGIYGTFNGDQVDDIQVDFVNEANGEIIEQYSTAAMRENMENQEN